MDTYILYLHALQINVIHMPHDHELKLQALSSHSWDISLIYKSNQMIHFDSSFNVGLEKVSFLRHMFCWIKLMIKYYVTKYECFITKKKGKIFHSKRTLSLTQNKSSVVSFSTKGWTAHSPSPSISLLVFMSHFTSDQACGEATQFQSYRRDPLTSPRGHRQIFLLNSGVKTAVD